MESSKPMQVIIRADGGFERGMGHISKQITFAKRLQALGHKTLFVTKINEATHKTLSESELNFIEISTDSLLTIPKVTTDFKPDLIILDILNTTSEYIVDLKKLEAKTVTFDNTDISAFECDLIFNIMYYHSPEIKKSVKHTALYEGYQYVILDDCYREIPNLNSDKVHRILLTQGGADTSNKTCFLIETLLRIRKMSAIPFKIDVVIGPAFEKSNITSIEKIASSTEVISIHRSPKGLAALISACDMAITAGGTTMWEISACKRPFYVLINEIAEDETARIVSSLGFGLYDGSSPSRECVEASLKKLILDAALRDSLAQKMKKYDLSKGIERILERMYEHKVISNV